jgi:DNA-binding response OmpR family regulator
MSLNLQPGVRPAPVPTRVCLVGEQWDDAGPALSVLARQDGLTFVGPARHDLQEAAQETAPAVVMIGPDVDYSSILASLDPADGRDSPLPVLVCITAQALEDDDLYPAADDFLLVPCTAAEMGKRLRRLARQRFPQAFSPRLLVGKVVLDLDTYQVTRDGHRVELAWLEFQLLKFFMENPGRVFTREQLLAHVWGVEDFGGTRTVDVHIRRLRHKLEVEGDHYFRTVKNVGYGMVAPQSFPSPPPEMP